MELNKKMLAMIFGMSSYGVVMGMNEEIKNEDQSASKYVFALRKNSENQARKLAAFARTDNNSESALEVAQWLTYKRSDITEKQKWQSFIDQFVENMERSYTFGNPIKNKKLGVVIEVVKEVTYGLQSGQDCSQLLVDRAQEEILKIEK